MSDFIYYSGSWYEIRAETMTRYGKPRFLVCRNGKPISGKYYINKGSCLRFIHHFKIRRETQ